MEKKIYPLYHGEHKMSWGMGTSVKDPKGFIFLAGTEGIDPDASGTGPREAVVVQGAAAQTKMALQKIKSRLEEMGSSLENIVKLIWYIQGTEFPDGVANSPNSREVMKAKEEFFKEHCPDFCMDNNPPPGDVIGVSGLALKDMLVEIACIAVLPD